MGSECGLGKDINRTGRVRSNEGYDNKQEEIQKNGNTHQKTNEKEGSRTTPGKGIHFF
jgi:hypothetical protein